MKKDVPAPILWIFSTPLRIAAMPPRSFRTSNTPSAPTQKPTLSVERFRVYTTIYQAISMTQARENKMNTTRIEKETALSVRPRTECSIATGPIWQGRACGGRAAVHTFPPATTKHGGHV
jgi:hypothetical protein